MNFKEQILNIKPFNQTSYSGIGLTKLASVAAYYLHKNNIPLTYNYLGISMFKMFPDAFCCDDEFKEYPSLDRIDREIMHMCITNSKKNETKVKKPSILVGSAKLGYQITEFGIAIAQQTNELINNPNKKSANKINTNTDAHKQSILKDYTLIKNSESYKQFETTGQIAKYSSWKIFGIKPFTQNSTVLEYIKLAQIKAKELNDETMISFIKKLLIQLI